MGYYDSFKKLIETFDLLNIEYMIIGGGSAIIQGFNQMTQDIDIYPNDSIENNTKIIQALEFLGFNLKDKDKKNILSGKDFIQFDEPFQIDLVFYPDGFNSYKEALKYKILKDNIPIMSIEGIIKSKESANRPKDKLVLPLLRDFLKFLKRKKEKICLSENYFEIPYGYTYADNQTISRWHKNTKKSLKERIDFGVR